jgi:hypothetical protein
MPPTGLSTRKIDFSVKRVGEVIYNVLGSASNHLGWPMPVIKNGRILRYVMYPAWGSKFLEITRALEKQSRSKKKIALAFEYPSSLARMLFIPEVKDLSKLTNPELKEIIVKVYDYCHALQEDVFCGKEGKNILKNKPLDFTNLHQEELTEAGKILSRLGGILFNYTELLYAFFHNFGHEFQGPFEHGSDKLVVKEFHDLRPSFWKETQEFPADNIKIIAAYDSRINVTFDMHNRMTETEPIFFNLKGYKVLVEDRELSLKEIKDLLNKVTLFYSKFLSGIPLEEEYLSKKYIEATFYSMKKAADLAGVDWRPSPHVLEHYNHVSKEIQGWIGFIATIPISVKLQQMRFNPLVGREKMKKAVQNHT